MVSDEPIVVTTEVSAGEWDAYVNLHPDATSYHLWAWRGVFERAFSHETAYLAARRSGAIVGVLPLVLFDTWLFGAFMVSLPFVNYGGLLADDDGGARALLRRAVALAGRRRIAHIELRHRRRMAPALPVKRHKVAMVLPLPPDAAGMWDRFDRKVRNQIRKAEKSGLTVEAHGDEALDDFYRIFAENMRDLGTPVVTRRLFEEVLRRFPQRTRIFLVRAGSVAVAGGVSSGFRTTLEVPWAASLKSYRSSCPNHLLYWAAIRHAIATGHTQFDFGRSTPDEGTFHFKRQWGAKPEPLCWEYELLSRSGLPDQSPKNPRFRTAIAIWKRLPVRVATLIGPPIVRCIP